MYLILDKQASVRAARDAQPPNRRLRAPQEKRQKLTCPKSACRLDGRADFWNDGSASNNHRWNAMIEHVFPLKQRVATTGGVYN